MHNQTYVIAWDDTSGAILLTCLPPITTLIQNVQNFVFLKRKFIGVLSTTLIYRRVVSDSSFVYLCLYIGLTIMQSSCLFKATTFVSNTSSTCLFISKIALTHRWRRSLSVTSVWADGVDKLVREICTSDANSTTSECTVSTKPSRFRRSQ